MAFAHAPVINMALTVAEAKEWLILVRVPGIGPVRYLRLLEQFGSPAAILAASRQALQAAKLPEPTIAFVQKPDWSLIEPDLAWLQQADNHLISWNDQNYPSQLQQTEHAPPVLYVHGDPEVLSLPQLAIVGTRSPSPDGERTAYDFSHYLAKSGLTISSGLARGIDAAAHAGALHGEGLTIAVMGTGLDRVYPAANRELAHKIAVQGGALISELAIGTPALAQNFPRRNRLISGLALGVLVVEAAQKSGSLITAHMAIEQGREVFAIPGSINNPLARGCHQLLRQGAKLVETVSDILEELAPVLSQHSIIESLASAQPEPPEKPEKNDEFLTNLAALQLDEQYQLLLQQMGAAPIAVDTLVERCGLTAEAVSSMLLILELHGYVEAKPGGYYYRIGTETV